MIAYVLRRVLLLLPIMLVAGSVTFALLHVIPGDPAAVMLGPEATPEQVAALRERLGLDEPLLAQYPRWLSRLARLDLGTSIFLDKPVTAAIRERIVPTLQLTLYALLIAVAVGIPAGVVAALHQDRLLDRALMLFAISGTAIADFFLAILLILLFSVTLRWLPSGGYTPFSDHPLQHLASMTLPALALGLSLAGLPARLVRATLLDVLREDFIRTAAAKGLMRETIAVQHALRNALLPAVTVLGYALGDLLGGAVVVETVFGLPGMGQLVVNSIARRDFPVIQGVVMVFAAIYLLTNLLVDVLYVYLDPRVRYAGR
ncbi:MAG: ABC transporter permease [Sphaerobacter sp.]|nr:ABC transporter permease [Sphaerobacter sp.]MDI3341382.1 ABC transporter permease [Sphaerobacter sp.]